VSVVDQLRTGRHSYCAECPAGDKKILLWNPHEDERGRHGGHETEGAAKDGGQRRIQLDTSLLEEVLCVSGDDLKPGELVHDVNNADAGERAEESAGHQLRGGVDERLVVAAADAAVAIDNAAVLALSLLGLSNINKLIVEVREVRASKECH
jgi:hypothetical protein